MKSRHIYLNIFLIDLPLTAITSILHRVSGIILFLSIPFILYFFYLSTESESSFILAKSIINKLYIKLLISFVYLFFLYHLISGIKHIIIDCGFFDSKSTAKKFSIFSLFIVLVFYILGIII